MGKKPAKRERYSIIISSLTDARKKPFVFSITKRMLIFVVCAVLVIVSASGLAAVLTSSQAASSSAQAGALKTQSDGQAALINSYSAQLIKLKQFRYMNGITSEGMKAIYKGTEPLGQSSTPPEATPALLPDEGPDGDMMASLVPGSVSALRSLGASTIKSIDMTDAIDQISAEFQANIDKRVEEIKVNEGFTEAEVVYNENEDGDSDIVNNWADVLSIYAAITMRDKLVFLTITPENLKLLRNIYNEMNQPSFYTKTTPYTEEDAAESGSESATKIKLTIYVNINSLTYSEDALLHDFDDKQKQKLELLMSPSNYTYFADILDLDVYDGMKSEELQEIISGLPEGKIGSEIAKAALIRVGHPYSNGRRGSGDYVDCSYLTRWAYDQVGITLPTSSVAQAQYCYKNGFVIEKEDLQPGDLIFWSKKDSPRWKGIHHVGIYLGNNKIIDASSSKGRVVVRNFWRGGSEWKFAFCGRPYIEGGAEAASETTFSREPND